MKLDQSNLPRNVVVIGDVRKRLAELPAASVDCVITSPPYYQLRDYGMANQIGLEDSVEGWVNELRLVMRGVARVIKPTGSVWLNLGDTFSRHEKFGAPAKSLLLGPERIALGLIEDGWTIRSKIIWAKTNNPPNPVRDRLSCSWEIIYFLTRSRHYHFDLDAIRVPHTSAPTQQRPAAAPKVPPKGRPTWAGPLAGNNAGLARLKAQGLVGHPLGKNPGDLWNLPASNFRGQHFATFPPALVQRPLLATCPERVCRSCKRPWQRDQVRRIGQLAVRGELRPSCPCRKGWQPGVVLDPFFGAGTVGLVAEQLGRNWLGIELNPAFAKLATRRIGAARISADEGSDRRAA
jgi:DNA modification methylase